MSGLHNCPNNKTTNEHWLKDMFVLVRRGSGIRWLGIKRGRSRGRMPQRQRTTDIYERVETTSWRARPVYNETVMLE
jgi:hypothetical protein